MEKSVDQAGSRPAPIGTPPARQIFQRGQSIALLAGGVPVRRLFTLQVDELKRAMGYPPEYLFRRGTRRDRIKLLGNGVCPPVMGAIVERLLG